MQISPLSWIEIDQKALIHNIKAFRDEIGPDIILAPCVKANAYGHGIVESAQIFLSAGADWLCVDSIYEAVQLREAGITSPIYIIGYVSLEQLSLVVELDVKLMVSNYETVDRLQQLAQKENKTIDIHIKVETGNNRQGLSAEELVPFVQHIAGCDHLNLEGISTHFSNIEDTDNHDFAESQQQRFDEAYRLISDQVRDKSTNQGLEIKIRHCANSAATMMYPETRYEMVRVGIASYGMWPSQLFKKIYQEKFPNGIDLQPALTWKTKVSQIKNIEKGETVGYGRTFTADRDMKIAILPVGYYDGFDRKRSNTGYVLVHGKECPVVGRVCMNIIMVDVTNVSEIRLEDEVVLLGKQGNAEITPEQFAEWIDTINYEVTTRIHGGPHSHIPRIVI